jgi:hypothetical protein
MDPILRIFVWIIMEKGRNASDEVVGYLNA